MIHHKYYFSEIMGLFRCSESPIWERFIFQKKKAHVTHTPRLSLRRDTESTAHTTRDTRSTAYPARDTRSLAHSARDTQSKIWKTATISRAADATILKVCFFSFQCFVCFVVVFYWILYSYCRHYKRRLGGLKRTLTLSLLSSKIVFSQPFKKQLYAWCSENL